MASIGTCVSAEIEMGDVTLHEDEVHHAYLNGTVDSSLRVGSCEITLSWNPAEVMATGVDDYDFDSLESTIDNVNGELTILAWTSGGNYLTDEFTIARIGFQALGTNGCDLIIDDSELLNDLPIAQPIPHFTTNGHAYVNHDGEELEGDMDGSGVLGVNDVRYLALHLLGETGFEDLHGCNPNVNCNGGANAADVRYLALHIAGDSAYTELYPSCTATI
jgi:hypothetical protein